MPREPYQRCSQAVLEAWLKPHIQANPLIESHFGVKFETLEEFDDGVTSHLVDVISGEKYAVRSQYVVGCDGAGSRVRKAIGGKLIGGPV
jgi:2-polyprenyl-6-methoxyphenol hydroxylase-like FAD-dependent oxidoreductase